MEMAVELTFKFENKNKETELGTLFKNMSFEPIDKANIENIEQFKESLLNIFPKHEKEVTAFTNPDNCGYDVYGQIFALIEHVYLQKAKCVVNICGGSNSMEVTQRFMKFIHAVGGKPLTCKVQSDEIDGMVKYTMSKKGNIVEDVVDYDPDW